MPRREEIQFAVSVLGSFLWTIVAPVGATVDKRQNRGGPALCSNLELSAIDMEKKLISRQKIGTNSIIKSKIQERNEIKTATV